MHTIVTMSWYKDHGGAGHVEPRYKQCHLKGHYVRLNDAPRKYSNMLELICIQSPLTGVIIFQSSEGDRRLRSRFLVIFSLLLQNVIYILFIFSTKSCPRLTSFTQKTKKLVFFNTACCYGVFLLLKKGSKGDRSPFFVSFNNTVKEIIVQVYFIQLKLGILVAEYFEEKQIQLNPCSASSRLNSLKFFFYTNIFVVDYTSVSLKKYFAMNFELCEPRNLLFNPALTVPKLQFGRFCCNFGTVNEVLNNKFPGSHSSNFLAKYLFRTH